VLPEPLASNKNYQIITVLPPKLAARSKFKNFGFSILTLFWDLHSPATDWRGPGPGEVACGLLHLLKTGRSSRKVMLNSTLWPIELVITPESRDRAITVSIVYNERW
jgi:hypothetical protein